MLEPIADGGDVRRRKRWRLDVVTVRLSIRGFNGADCEQCETINRLLDHIDCDVELMGVTSRSSRLTADAQYLVSHCP